MFELEIVDLQKNECIDQVFNNKQQLQKMPQVVSKKCGYDESGKRGFEVSCEKTAQCSWFVKYFLQISFKIA